MTIKDIAKASGYGVGTVSRVINNHPDVSEQAREKILKVIEEMGFEPNENAKMLKQRNGNSIGVIVKGNRNMLFADMLEAIQQSLKDTGENVEIVYIDEDANEVDCAVKMCKNSSPKGIFFLGANLIYFDEHFDQITVPCVILSTDGRSLEEHKNLSSVSVDDTQATYEIAKYITDHGHVNIGILGGFPSKTQISYSRYMGCLNCFKEKNIPFDKDRNYEVCRFSMEDGYRATQKLLDKNKNITAIIAFSDTIALGAIRAIKDMNLSVPNDISIVGFDGIISAKYSVPRIATICQDTRKIAQTGVEIILKKIHYPGAGEHVLIPYTFEPGESVKQI
ncbi:MAG: LacI family DNA-binding transcriptional regulator [Lachnospiraceae bacterium]